MVPVTGFPPVVGLSPRQFLGLECIVVPPHRNKASLHRYCNLTSCLQNRVVRLAGGGMGGVLPLDDPAIGTGTGIEPALPPQWLPLDNPLLHPYRYSLTGFRRTARRLVVGADTASAPYPGKSRVPVFDGLPTEIIYWMKFLVFHSGHVQL